MNSFSDQQRVLNQSLDYNTLKKDKIFTRKRINLDKGYTFDYLGVEAVFKHPYRGFWVVDYSDTDFQLNFKPNVNNNDGDAMPIKPNMQFDFEQLVDGANFEFESQAGKWVDILFFHKGKPNIGNTEVDVSGKSISFDGSSFNNDNISVSNTSSLILGPSSDRTIGTIINQSSEIIYIGDSTSTSHVDFKKKCVHLMPNESFEWRNSSGLFARTDINSTDEVVIFEEFN